MEILPRFLLKEGVVAVGEIGYDEQTPAEDKYFRAQLERAKELNMLVQIHTPHRDKKRGTSRSMDVCVADWGVSDPLAVPKTAQLMRERGIADEHIKRVTYDNPLKAFAAGGQMAENDWLSPAAIDQRTLFEGNSVLRGGQEPRIDSKRTAKERMLIE